MRLSQEAIRRMIDSRGGSGGGGRSIDPSALAGIASQAWVEEGYISKAFWNELFIIHKKVTTVVMDGDTEVSRTVTTNTVFAPNEIPSSESTTDSETGYVTTVTTEVDNIEAKKGVWTNYFLSALGLNASGGGGGGAALNEPLLSINNASLGTPQLSNVGIIWNGSSWVYGQTGMSQQAADLRYLQLAGGTMTGQIQRASGHYWYDARDYAIIRNTMGGEGDESYHPVFSSNTQNGDWSMGTLGNNDKLYAVYSTGASTGYKTIEFPTDTCTILGTNTTYVSGGKGYINGVEITTISGSSGSTNRLSGDTAYIAWGKTYWQNGVPNSISGNMSDVGNITPQSNATYSIGSKTNHFSTVHMSALEVWDDTTNEDFIIQWMTINNKRVACLYGWETVLSDIIIGAITPADALYFDSTNARWGIGTSTPAYKLDVNGTINCTSIRIGGYTITADTTNQGLRINGAGLYADTYISALGVSSGGGGGATLNEPLLSINNASLGTPQQSNVGIIWNGSSWVYGQTGGQFTALFSNNDTNLSITIGGTTKTISGLYALRLKGVGIWDSESGSLYGDLDDLDGTTYSVVTNYYGNGCWANAPSFGSNYGGAIIVRGVNDYLMGQLAWSAAHGTTDYPTKDLWWRARATGGWKNDWKRIAFIGDVSITAGTGLSGGTITTNGTIAISSTYQNYISHGETAYNSLGNYLPLAGGTMTGLLKVATGIGIEDTTGNGLLVYHPTSWTGVTSSQWGVGAGDCQGVIRSSATDLKHYRGGTLYNIVDSLYEEKAISEAGWYRVADVTDYGASLMLSISQTYYYGEPAPATFIISHTYAHDSIIQIGGSARLRYAVTNVRLMRYASGKIYIEIYYARNDENTVGIELLPLGHRLFNGLALIDFTKTTSTSGLTLADSTPICEGNVDGVTYTQDGGVQGPSYFGRSKVGFLMSNQTVHGDTSYKDWMYMDCYEGSDAGGATAIGVSRDSGRMFVMRSDYTRTTWNTMREVVVANENGSVNLSASIGEVLTLDSTDTYSHIVYNLSSVSKWSVGCDSSKFFWYNSTVGTAMSLLNNGNLGIGTSSPSYKLHVNGSAKVDDLWIGNIHITYDSTNGGLYIGGGLAASTYVSALGTNASGGGGGVALNEPLASINNAMLDTPSQSGSAIIWNGSSWTYQVPSSGGGGTVTSVDMSPAIESHLSVSGGPITSYGTITIGIASGYAIPSTSKQSNWDTAYSNSHVHDNMSVLSGITATKVSNWDTAYTDHHTHSNMSVLNDITSTKVNNWDTAYSWGNHSAAGYSTPSSVTLQMQNYSYISSGVIHIGDSSITPLTSTSGTFWGQSWVDGGSVTGNLSSVGNISSNGGYINGFYGIDFEGVSGSGAHGGFLDFHFSGSSADYTSRIIESAAGTLSFIVNNSYWPVYEFGIGDRASMLVGTYDGSYVQIGGIKLVYDSSNNAIKVQKSDNTAANFYATGGISALGIGAGVSSIDAMTFGNLKVNNTLTFGNNYASIYMDDFLYIDSNSDISVNGVEFENSNAHVNKLYLDPSHYIYVSSGKLYYYNGSTAKEIAFTS